MRDHGGDIDSAIRRFGGDPALWIDLSTGINRQPWLCPGTPEDILRVLPTAEVSDACADAARSAFRAPQGTLCLPVAGAQAAIRLLPFTVRPGRAGVVGPTYNEHAASFEAAGWHVTEVATIADLQGFDVAIVVNPNNPDGRHWSAEALLALREHNGLAIVDESFADVDPAASLCPRLGGVERLVVLRSFGKFWGLAGLRLGFALGSAPEIDALRTLAGPWTVSGPALHAGRLALADAGWAAATRTRLAAEAPRLDSLAAVAGWSLVGGTTLFRLYETGDAEAAQASLARERIWSRRFPYSAGWLRLGLPGSVSEWDRLAAALIRAAADRCP